MYDILRIERIYQRNYEPKNITEQAMECPQRLHGKESAC